MHRHLLSSRHAATAGLVAAVIVIAAAPAAAQTAAVLYERTLAREQAAPAASAPVGDLRALARSYEGIVRRYPTLVDGAFIIIALVGAKLLVEYAAALGWIHFEVPKWLSLGLIAFTFLIAYLQARRKGAVELMDETEDEAAALLGE